MLLLMVTMLLYPVLRFWMFVFAPGATWQSYCLSLSLSLSLYQALPQARSLSLSLFLFHSLFPALCLSLSQFSHPLSLLEVNTSATATATATATAQR